MSNVLKFLTTLLYYIIGNNMYKSLRSEPNLLDDLAKVWNTMKKLLSVKTSDEVVKGINVKKDYLFVDIPLFKVLSLSGLVLFDSYKDKINLSDKYILCNNHFVEFIGKFGQVFTCHFDWLSIVKKDLEQQEVTEGEETKKESYEDALNRVFNEKVEQYKDSIMTASEWNAFWNNILSKSSKQLAMKPLEINYVSLNQISSLVDTDDKPEVDPLVVDTNIPKFSRIRLFGENSDYIDEFTLVCGLNDANISPRVVKSLELTEDSINEDFDVENYLFPTKVIATEVK